MPHADVPAKLKRLRLMPAFVSVDLFYLKFIILLEESKQGFNSIGMNPQKY